MDGNLSVAQALDSGHEARRGLQPRRLRFVYATMPA